ncbi:hypothetical protein ACOMHN_065568 [Nucella lapillus]
MKKQSSCQKLANKNGCSVAVKIASVIKTMKKQSSCQKLANKNGCSIAVKIASILKAMKKQSSCQKLSSVAEVKLQHHQTMKNSPAVKTAAVKVVV